MFTTTIEINGKSVHVATTEVRHIGYGVREILIGAGIDGRLLVVFKATLYRGEVRGTSRIHGECPIIVHDTIVEWAKVTLARVAVNLAA